MKHLHIPVFFLVAAYLLASCDINQRDISPEGEFVKIFNHSDEQLRFFPQSVEESDQGGFIILSGVKADTAENEFPSTYLIGTDKQGKLIWSDENNYLAPEGRLLKKENGMSYIAMDNQFNGVGLDIDLTSGQVIRQVPLDLKMPLFSYVNSRGDFLVLGHDFINRASKISLFSKEFNQLRTANLNINTDLQNMVQKHLNKSGKQYPFFIGEFFDNPDSGFFVNCFSNYSLRIVFLDRGGNLLPGDIYSFQTEAAVSSFVQQDESRFSLTRYYGGNNYLIPEINVQPGISQNFNNIDALSLFELSPEAAVRSLKATIDGAKSILFASHTNSNSLIIYQYNMETDEEIGVYMQDFNNKIEIADMIQAKDGAIVVLGKIFVLGKYPRPLLVKIPADEFSAE